jgi:hypothetical protein
MGETASTEPARIERRHDLGPEEFVQSYLRKNRPVVITDAMKDWPSFGQWKPAYFKEKFGHLPVVLHGDFFEKIDEQPLGSYVDALPAYERHVREDGSVDEVLPYLRYSENRDGAEGFTGLALKASKGMWSRPYFLPSRGYIYPLDLFSSDPTTKRYPDFGIYISPRGAVTKLHTDGNWSNAVLCQFFGQKRCFLFPPRTETWLPRDWVTFKRSDININKNPAYGQAEPLEAVLNPGDILFIPRAWFHEVYTTQTSVSLTYNFVHVSDGLRTAGTRTPWILYVCRSLGVRFLGRVKALSHAGRRG